MTKLGKLYQELTTVSLDGLGELSQAARWVLMGLVAAAVWVFSYLLIVSPAMDRLAAATAQEPILIEEFAKKFRQARQLAQVEEAQVLTNTQLQTALTKLPAASHHAILAQLETFAKAAGVQILSVTNGAKVEQAHFAEREIRLVAVGTYGNFGRFLAQIAQGDPLLTVHDFQINKVDNHHNLQLTVTLKTYQKAAPKPVAQEGLHE